MPPVSRRFLLAGAALAATSLLVPIVVRAARDDERPGDLQPEAFHHGAPIGHDQPTAIADADAIKKCDVGVLHNPSLNTVLTITAHDSWRMKIDCALRIHPFRNGRWPLAVPRRFAKLSAKVVTGIPAFR